jgi:NADPH-dependent curcumin reductase CurA
MLCLSVKLRQTRKAQLERPSEHLAVACPDGIDVYFENVGGAVFDAVLPSSSTTTRSASTPSAAT